LHGNGTLRDKAPAEENTATRFEFDPERPVPTIGGNIDSGKDLVRRGAQHQVLQAGDYGATNQLPLSARRDVLSFETAPLERDLDVVGPMHVDLWVSSSAKDTDITAKLIDVYPPSADYPAGFAMNLEDGILRLRFRESREREKLHLWATANVFARGHRLRLDISSSNFPMYDVNPNTGEGLHRHTHAVKAINSIHHSRQGPSCLILPVRE
jgi:putative CocE/NonD family hydrolase